MKAMIGEIMAIKATTRVRSIMGRRQRKAGALEEENKPLFSPCSGSNRSQEPMTAGSLLGEP